MLCRGGIGSNAVPSPAWRGHYSACTHASRQQTSKLEDFLENKPREAELVVESFRQFIPGDGTPATENTTAYLSYDDKNLYVVFVCHDSSGQVRAHLSKREDVD